MASMAGRGEAKGREGREVESALQAGATHYSDPGSVDCSLPMAAPAGSAHRLAAWRTQRRTVPGCTPTSLATSPTGRPTPTSPTARARNSSEYGHSTSCGLGSTTPAAGPAGRRQPAARDRRWRQPTAALRRSPRPAGVQADDQPPHRPAGSHRRIRAAGTALAYRMLACCCRCPAYHPPADPASQSPISPGSCRDRADQDAHAATQQRADTEGGGRAPTRLVNCSCVASSDGRGLPGRAPPTTSRR
jgi:hypothetical protein